MPLVTVYDVDYNPALNQIVAGTFGRSIQSFDLSQINYPEIVNTDETKITDINIILATNPVPSDGVATLINPKMAKVKLNIVNIMGSVMTSIYLDNTKQEIRLDRLAPGLYFIIAENNKMKPISFVKI
jgi:hypothetical protein